MVVATLADPLALDPHRVTDFVGQEVVANVCDTLVRPRPGSGRPEPALASAWATPDQRVWTFTLRGGVLFQDGAALDAEAVVANFEYLRRELRFPARGRAVGPLVFELALERPDATLLATLAQPRFSIESPRQLGGGSPVCTGPFRLESKRPGPLELRRWDGYWGEPPRLSAVRFLRFPDADALVRGLAAGEADVSSGIAPRQAAALHQQPSLLLDSQTGLNLVYLALNLARAVDRVSLVRLLGGHAAVAQGPLPPSVLGRDLQGRGLALDPQAARQMLAAAGVRPGTPLVVSVSRQPRPYLSEPLRVAARVRDDLVAVGFAATVRELDWNDQVALTSRGDYDAALLGWHADTLEPDDFLSALLESDAVGTTNRSRFRSPEMDALLARARGQPDTAARLALYRQALQLFQRDMPFVPLFHASVFTAHRREVQGLVIGPTGILRFDKAWKQR